MYESMDLDKSSQQVTQEALENFIPSQNFIMKKSIEPSKVIGKNG